MTPHSPTASAPTAAQHPASTTCSAQCNQPPHRNPRHHTLQALRAPCAPTTRPRATHIPTHRALHHPKRVHAPARSHLTASTVAPTLAPQQAHSQPETPSASSRSTSSPCTPARHVAAAPSPLSSNSATRATLFECELTPSRVDGQLSQAGCASPAGGWEGGQRVSAPSRRSFRDARAYARPAATEAKFPGCARVREARSHGH